MSHWLTAMVHRLGDLPDVVDGLLVGCRWQRRAHCRHPGGVRGGVHGGGRELWPHCLGGRTLLLREYWCSSSRRREDRLVEARRRAALHVRPCRRAVVVRPWIAAILAGVGVVYVAAVRVAVVPILVALERRRGVG